jgi:multiple sugar transport system substrate-binding protein
MAGGMRWTRRNLLEAGAAAGMAAGGLFRAGPARSQGLDFTPEPGAALRVLRWEAFVAGDAEQWAANSERFTERTGVPVTIESVPWPEVRPRAMEAAESGGGPDIVLGWFDDAHLFPDRLLVLSDLADDLAGRYGDWYDVCKRYGTHQGQWIALPLGAAGSCMVYRESHLRAAGFDRFPTDTDGLLQLCRALAENGTPPGMVLGDAVGDATIFTHWLLWAFGGKLVDIGGLTVIDSIQTRAALDYARELYQTFVPGTTGWLDPDNNLAFDAGEISLTMNGVSIYHNAKTSDDARLREIAEDIRHANLPVGPIGTPTELFLFTQAMVYNHTAFPNAAKAYLAFMWEREQYEPWQTAASGYITQPLVAYEQNEVWQQDPKILPYRDCTARMLWNGYAGPLGPASARALHDNIVVRMFRAAASGELSIDDAIGEAERAASRHYRV